MKLLLLTTCFATLLSAQTTFEIRGSVTEPGLGGIAGAEVRAMLAPTPSGDRPPNGTPLTAFTDGRGQFVIRTTTPGSYSLGALLAGYAPSALSSPADARATLDANRPRADVELQMVRLGQVIGRVLDAETREPKEGIEVFVLRKEFDERMGTRWSSAFPFPTSEVTATSREALFKQVTDQRTTKKNGAFTLTGLLPGEFAATVTPTETARWSAGFSADDLKVSDQEYGVLYWPGGVEKEDVRPVTLTSGGVASLGDILAKKAPHYRAHVTLAQGTCPEGESMRLSLFNGRFNGRAPSPVPEAFPCGSELLLRGLLPGSYHLYAVSDWQGQRDNIQNAAWATAQFEISETNVEVSLVPERGVVLEGQLVAADGLKELPQQFRFGVQPGEFAPGATAPPEEFIEWLDDRKFRIAVSTKSRTFNLGFFGGRQVYVKELRYNGVPLPGLKVPLNPGASAQRLDIVLDDKFGVVAGTVEGAPGLVMVFLWAEGSNNPVATIPAENGVFRSESIIPGEYRVTTATPEIAFYSVATTIDQSKSGQKVTIRAGETTTVNVRATGASR